jgi:hypothetical protein
MYRYLYATVAAVFLIGCSDTPTKTVEKKKEEKLEPLTGRQAFQQMYISARGWAPDALGLQLKSLQLSDVKADKGKAAAWQCTFVSLGRSRARVYTWSAVESEGNLHKGVFAGLEESYSESRQSKPFVIPAFKTDSDEAYAEAVKKSAEYMKKNPDKPVNYLLELTPRFPDLAWRIIWGDTPATSDYSIFVDATTGAFLERAH